MKKKRADTVVGRFFFLFFILSKYSTYAEIKRVGSGSGTLKIRNWIRIRNKSFRICKTGFLSLSLSLSALADISLSFL